MDKIIDKYSNSDKTILDPCSGNSFHTFLFNTYLKMNVITIDIRPEENVWIETIEGDGLEFIKKKWKITRIKYYFYHGLISQKMNYHIIYSLVSREIW